MLDIILDISTFTFITTATLIIVLFLRDLGFTRYVYELIATHPRIDTFLAIAGDALYMIGGGIATSAFYSLIIDGTFHVTALVIGFIMIVIGAYYRRM